MYCSIDSCLYITHIICYSWAFDILCVKISLTCANLPPFDLFNIKKHKIVQQINQFQPCFLERKKYIKKNKKNKEQIEKSDKTIKELKKEKCCWFKIVIIIIIIIIIKKIRVCEIPRKKIKIQNHCFSIDKSLFKYGYNVCIIYSFSNVIWL